MKLDKKKFMKELKKRIGATKLQKDTLTHGLFTPTERDVSEELEALSSFQALKRNLHE